MLNNGAMIADRYRLQRLIATGGMGQVWEALDTRLDRRVAVKVLKAEFSTDPTFRQRFRTEARTTAQLNHPGIASIYDYGETQDPSGGEIAYLVMEFVQGEPLNAVLSRLNRLSVAQGLDMLEQTGRALQVAHLAGVVHRDVKPGNILVTPTGQVKITDFGIAKAVDASPVTKTGMVMGTAQYIAPEQATGEDATAASDVYSLGVVGYEALSGARPFTGDGALTVAMKHVREAPPPLPADLPPNVRELIEITMAKDPGQRYTDGGEFADAVAAVRSGRRPTPPGGLPVAPANMTGATRVLPPGPTMIIPGARADQATTRYQTPPQPMRQPAEPPASATQVMSGPRTPVGPMTFTGPADHETGRFTAGQKAMAGLAVGALILIAGVGIVLASNNSHETTPPARTSAVVAPPLNPPTTTTTPTTTTRERPVPPPPVTTYEPPPTTTPEPTTTPPPTTTTPPKTTTTTPKTTTTTPKTTTGRWPWQPGDIPSWPVTPGANPGGANPGGAVSPGSNRNPVYPQDADPYSPYSSTVPQQGLP
ncbi:protein kinase domain-containing protein [Nocardia seriolae]|uniref:non-specific serine/threonine protein kinase n=1 Tax=Nocardia seriolae TaxID=37332 RepID=A0ABC9YM27_9NOCA|nr:protein kinase [Nocardia seriolae]RLP33742.1 serine/threonine protein kinase [Nocardia seriolae]WKY52647.1 protein kinase [Nocardia seriolae]BEK84074.1 serine/threonine-protein kinase [Nocardia seriolae]BEK92119.1 serine/threonine-protein kinase [Nocardia seriolae]GAM44436.1 serine/threonine protein kinase [Nocardia seriolae]